ncbi:MAG TPA: hypothetical protein PL002_14950, partial [Flavobacteriales bacterium]|nr:hypothetical protein [Flavobacteriales bacterium]
MPEIRIVKPSIPLKKTPGRRLRAALGSAAALAAVVVLACLGSGCSSVGYVAQSIGGHLDLMRRARPVA